MRRNGHLWTSGVNFDTAVWFADPDFFCQCAKFWRFRDVFRWFLHFICWMSAIFLLPVCLTYWPRKYITRVVPTSIIPTIIGGKVNHVTRHKRQLFNGKRAKVKVTRSRDLLVDENTITRQCMVISTSNLAGIIDVGVDACGILSMTIGLTNRK